MRPHYWSLGELLRKRVFEIPEYQRTYSWTERQRDDLFGDIERLLRPEEAGRSHFMATIACLAPPATDGAEEADGFDRSGEEGASRLAVTVVDGQQRLTSLVILLKAIEKKLRQLAREKPAETNETGDVASRLAVLLYDENLGREVLLQANHENSAHLRNYLCDGRLLSEKDAATSADWNLRDACLRSEGFVDRIANDSGVPSAGHGQLLRLLATVEDRLRFICIDLDDHATVYRVFETINSRGLVVDALDKSKSILMGIATSQATGRDAERMVAELHKIWTTIYRTIGVSEVNGEELLRFAATLIELGEHSRVLTAADSIEVLRRICSEGGRGSLFRVTNFLVDVAKALRDIARSPATRAVARVSQARLLYVGISLARGLTADERSLALEQWERVTFRIFGLCRKDARTKRGDYTRLACRIYHGTASAKGAPALPPSLAEICGQLQSLAGDEYAIEKAVVSLVKPDWYDWEGTLRYILFRYEEHLAGGDVNRDTWNVIWRESASKTIEHVFPQTPSAGWTPRYDPAEEKSLISRLGNLAILPQAINSAASNQPFTKKKEIYEEKGALGLRHIKDICKKAEWRREEIAEREELIVRFAKSRWADLPGEPTLEQP